MKNVEILDLREDPSTCGVSRTEQLLKIKFRRKKGRESVSILELL
jgi:hypothetical protein